MTRNLRGINRPNVWPAANYRVLAAALSIVAGTANQACAQATLTTLYSFPGGAGGGNFVGDLLVDSAGPGGAVRALYGADPFNGASGCQYGCGLDFKLTPPKHGSGPWTYKALANFSGGAGGSNPYGPLFTAASKIKAKTPLYGTSSGFFGGTGNGTVYALVGGTVTTIYSFTGKLDGGGPGAGVVADASGALYTTAEEGGGAANCGTVIKLTPPAQGQTAWTETTIWQFSGTKDGCNPNGIVIDQNGVLYGTAFSGGSANTGTAFSLTPPVQGQTAWTEQTLISFRGYGGSSPYFGPSLGQNGVLYGTTYDGGSKGYGIAFALSPPKPGGSTWTEGVLWNFTNGSDGANPDGALLIDSSGNLFGATSEGASTNNGTVFKLSAPEEGRTAWTQTTLWSFTGGSDGGSPAGGLVADKAGTLYGTSELGATGGCAFGDGCGVVFSLAGTGFVP